MVNSTIALKARAFVICLRGSIRFVAPEMPLQHPFLFCFCERLGNLDPNVCKAGEVPLEQQLRAELDALRRELAALEAPTRSLELVSQCFGMLRLSGFPNNVHHSCCDQDNQHCSRGIGNSS